MNILRIIALLLLLACTAEARAPEPGFPGEILLGNTGETLSKLGEYRYVYRMFFKLYDVALYAEPKASAKDVLSASVSYRLQFRYLREIDKAIILKSSAKILDKNLNPDELRQIAERVDRLNAAYQTVKDGDHSSLTFQPDVGTTLRINGSPVTTIEGADFARLYFKIWLGERPISDSLREALSGRAEE